METTSEKQSIKTNIYSFENYPIREGKLTEMEYSSTETKFSLWSPVADEAKVLLYESGHEGSAYNTHFLKKKTDGTWEGIVPGDLHGKFYTFNVKVNRKWLGESPGIMAKAVGVNGIRAAIIDLHATNPKGWENDCRPPLNNFSEIVIYELHHRDFSIDFSSGIIHKGKFLALTEEHTNTYYGEKTGIGHLKELGVTHAHLLPSFDFGSIDESQLDGNHYNWGYDPMNYNVPEGSYSTNPFDPVVRIREFKQMVQALHKAGIRVILDVVYNHTYNTIQSNFEKTVPGYFYRLNNDGEFANASGCGNETASERTMMRKYMIKSVLYWVNEYHIDGFRFDLMGIHDIETMNAIRTELNMIDPTIFIYGEGWAAESPQLSPDRLALKGNAYKMPGIAVFSDEMRDGIRGPWNNDSEGAYLVGKQGYEMSIMYGLVGGIEHPQINYEQVNYCHKAWANQPTQMISYVSCHDDMCLTDRIKATLPHDASIEERIALHKLAETFVFTSQGIPFIYTGDEFMRDKKGVSNSYNSPDNINAIRWKNKTTYRDVFDYIKNLIALRKSHPAFHMGDAHMIRKHMEFLPVNGDNLIAFILKNHANGDSWNNIIVAFNSRKKSARIRIPEGVYTIVCKNGKINLMGMSKFKGASVIVPSQSALILHQ